MMRTRRMLFMAFIAVLALGATSCSSSDLATQGDRVEWLDRAPVLNLIRGGVFLVEVGDEAREVDRFERAQLEHVVYELPVVQVLSPTLPEGTEVGSTLRVFDVLHANRPVSDLSHLAEGQSGVHLVVDVNPLDSGQSKQAGTNLSLKSVMIIEGTAAEPSVRALPGGTTLVPEAIEIWIAQIGLADLSASTVGVRGDDGAARAVLAVMEAAEGRGTDRALAILEGRDALPEAAAPEIADDLLDSSPVHAPLRVTWLLDRPNEAEPVFIQVTTPSGAVVNGVIDTGDRYVLLTVPAASGEEVTAHLWPSIEAAADKDPETSVTIQAAASLSAVETEALVIRGASGRQLKAVTLDREPIDDVMEEIAEVDAETVESGLSGEGES